MTSIFKKRVSEAIFRFITDHPEALDIYKARSPMYAENVYFCFRFWVEKLSEKQYNPIGKTQTGYTL